MKQPISNNVNEDEANERKTISTLDTGREPKRFCAAWDHTLEATPMLRESLGRIPRNVGRTGGDWTGLPSAGKKSE
ncbi:hypothetical protein GLAREA_03372 [Glarea lozoyensis ATCC 20868]|uniref:Uncharacterized protein n=1 Tax=Glarea lozoyensis (strain ATCC 20868 / MF5171) TaxID=1116229 RepID=S3CXT4_GLAL2|nr:uncharacterized protein GLAREA_03372 [Glarea lozoyensis ATCC 20868]EPE30405.1 hypothetical protein GLAREA_03372 [Glarea lozoyensis ATCC 20868]